MSSEAKTVLKQVLIVLLHYGTFVRGHLYIEQDIIAVAGFLENLKGAEGRKIAEKRKKYEVIMLRIYRQLSELVKSVLVVSTLLAVYKVTGCHDFWIQLVGNYIH